MVTGMEWVSRGGVDVLLLTRCPSVLNLDGQNRKARTRGVCVSLTLHARLVPHLEQSGASGLSPDGSVLTPEKCVGTKRGDEQGTRKRGSRCARTTTIAGNTRQRLHSTVHSKSIFPASVQDQDQSTRGLIQRENPFRCYSAARPWKLRRAHPSLTGPGTDCEYNCVCTNGLCTRFGSTWFYAQWRECCAVCTDPGPSFSSTGTPVFRFKLYSVNRGQLQ